MTNENMFYLKDIGSTTGTFIKIEEPMELKENMIIEMLKIHNVGLIQHLDLSVKDFVG